jgi:putative FmdB family regulatory protein
MRSGQGHDPSVPIYDYACGACDTRFEELLRSDAPAPPCPTCGTEETERLLSTFLTPNMSSGQRRFQRDVGSAMADMGCCGGGGCGTHAG